MSRMISIKSFLLFLGMFLFIFFGLGFRAYATFNLFSQTCNPDGSTTGGNGTQSDVCKKYNNSSSDGKNNNVVLSDIHQATDIIAWLAGAIAVIMIVVSGFSMITSGGSSETMGNARKRITNASIGLVIIVLAWTIIRFVTDSIIK